MRRSGWRARRQGRAALRPRGGRDAGRRQPAIAALSPLELADGSESRSDERDYPRKACHTIATAALAAIVERAPPRLIKKLDSAPEVAGS